MSKLALFVLTILLVLPSQVKALSSNWQRDGAVDVRLISGIEGVGQKTMIPLGIEVRMEPGWHTYWRSPGVAGMPPQLDWTKSQNDTGNLRKATLFYPAPKRYSDHDLETIGYQSRVVFPIDAEVRHVGQPLVIDTTLNLLACSTLCVPKTFVLKLKVPKDAAIEGPEADLLNPARALIPGQDEERSGLALKDLVNNGASLSFEITSSAPIVSPDIFIESEPEIPFTAPDVKISADRREARLTVKPSDIQQDLSAHVGTPLTLTIVDDGHALEVPVALPALPGSGGGEKPLLSLRLALLLAIAGGFILNLMPCVLPVLSLKIMALVGHGGGEPTFVRRSFLTSAAGIMFSFLLLALTTVMLKKLGLTLGWGVQFQQPLFLIILILLLTFFAANMWGLFDIRLPSFLADKLADHHPRMAGDFATGALATLLATPCTAPFLGTAVGFALASGTAKEIVAIFMALGFGMTLPYLAIAIIPELATFLPKPGAWMKRLRIVLGFALALTAIWLMWILSAQIMSRYALTVAACMIGIVAILGIPTAGISKKLGLLGFAIIAVSLALGGAPAPADVVAKIDKLWQRFDEPSIAIQVATGRTVFVDITADWCLTCKANDKFVLSDEDISQRLFHGDIVAMQGDWTNPDPDITNFLHKFRRYGIPFNVVYGPGAPQGITLPELLTHDTVMEALNKAEKN